MQLYMWIWVATNSLQTNILFFFGFPQPRADTVLCADTFIYHLFVSPASYWGIDKIHIVTVR